MQNEPAQSLQVTIVGDIEDDVDSVEQGLGRRARMAVLAFRENLPTHCLGRIIARLQNIY